MFGELSYYLLKILSYIKMLHLITYFRFLYLILNTLTRFYAFNKTDMNIIDIFDIKREQTNY